MRTPLNVRSDPSRPYTLRRRQAPRPTLPLLDCAPSVLGSDGRGGSEKEGWLKWDSNSKTGRSVTTLVEHQPQPHPSTRQYRIRLDGDNRMLRPDFGFDHDKTTWVVGLGRRVVAVEAVRVGNLGKWLEDDDDPQTRIAQPRTRSCSCSGLGSDSCPAARGYLLGTTSRRDGVQ